MELKLQKNYKGTLNATLQNTTTGEIEIKLSIAPISDMGFITIEPGVNGKEETIFYHRILGNSVFAYGVNRDNPLQHIIGSSIILANSIDVFNLLLDKEQAPYVFKKSINDVIIKGGTFYINSKIFTINDLDTSVAIEDKVLEPNITNYVYIKNNDYYITQSYDDGLYPICDIVVDAGGVITNITKHKFSNILNASGYAPLDTLGKIPFQYLPAVFAAIEEYPTIGDFPVEGDEGILYVVIGESLSYRWDGDSYVAMTGIGDMFSGNNLSELHNKETARNNLNVYSQIQVDNMVDTLNDSIDTKQNILVNQTNIKSVNGNSLVGSGNISLSDNRIDLVAGEAMSVLQVYRRGLTSLSEDINKFYLAKANNASKLDYEGIVNTSVITDETFSGIFNGIINVGNLDIGVNKYNSTVYSQYSNTGTSTSYVTNTSFSIGFTLTKKIKLNQAGWRGGYSSGTNSSYIEILQGTTVIGTSEIRTNINGGAGNQNLYNFLTDIYLEPGVLYTEKIYCTGAFIYNYIYNGSVDYYIYGYNAGVATIGGNIYLQDDGTIGPALGTNTIVIGKVFSDNEIEFIKEKTVIGSLQSIGGGSTVSKSWTFIPTKTVLGLVTLSATNTYNYNNSYLEYYNGTAWIVLAVISATNTVSFPYEFINGITYRLRREVDEGRDGYCTIRYIG